MPIPNGVVRKQIVRGKKGIFVLCADATNGRIYYRRDGSRRYVRFTAPPSTHERLSLTIGKRGLFCLCGNGRAGEMWWRSFKGGDWKRYTGPREGRNIRTAAPRR